MTSDTIIRAALPSAAAAAILGIPADLYHFTIDGRAEHAGEALFRAHGLLLVVAMGLLIVALAGFALHLGDRLGLPGRAGVVLAFAGTLLVLANISTEAFAMSAAPEALSDPKGYWLAVIIASFAIFALGWLLVGIACFKQGAGAAALLLCVGAVVGFTPVQGAYVLLLAGAAATALRLLGARRRTPEPAAFEGATI